MTQDFELLKRLLASTQSLVHLFQIVIEGEDGTEIEVGHGVEGRLHFELKSAEL